MKNICGKQTKAARMQITTEIDRSVTTLTITLHSPLSINLFEKFGWMENAECGVRSAECGVRSAECGKRGVWKMRSMENEEWKCINFFIQHKKCLEMVYS